MSRSNTHYWNLYRENADRRRTFITRRGVWQRKPRFPDWSIKSWHRPPPAEVKRIWSRTLRARYKAEIARHADDPELFRYSKAWSDRLWDWY